MIGWSSTTRILGFFFWFKVVLCGVSGGVLQHFLFVDDCGAAEEVVSGLAAFIEAQSDEVGDQEDREEVEEEECFHPGPENSGEEGSRAKGNGANSAQTEGALAEGGTVEEAFTDGKVKPRDDDLDAVGVVECIEEGWVHGGQRFSVGEAAGEGFEPSGVFGHGSGMGFGPDNSEDDKVGYEEEDDGIHKEGDYTEGEPCGGHGAIFSKDGVKHVAGFGGFGRFFRPGCFVLGHAFWAAR